MSHRTKRPKLFASLSVSHEQSWYELAKREKRSIRWRASVPDMIFAPRHATRPGWGRCNIADRSIEGEEGAGGKASGDSNEARARGRCERP
jgi:hypothetical protein